MAATMLARKRTAIAQAREYYDRAAAVGMDSPEPLTKADIAERSYLHHLAVGHTIAALELHDRKVDELLDLLRGKDAA